MPQHKTTVWSVAIDTDKPLSSTVHTSANDAWGEIIEHYAVAVEQCWKAYAFLEAGDFDNLREYIADLKKTFHPTDDYTVDKHEIILEVPWPSDEGVSEDEHDYGVTMTSDVKADSPEGAVKEFVKEHKIGTIQGLTFLVSNLKTGEYVELDGEPTTS